MAITRKRIINGRRVVTTVNPGTGNVISTGQVHAKPKEPVGSILKRMISGLTGLKPVSGCDCQSLADQMDRWGVSGCTSNKRLIISKLVENAKVLLPAIRSDQAVSSSFAAKAISLAAAIVPASVLSAGAEMLLGRAIAEASKSTVKPRAVRSRPSRNSYPFKMGPGAARFVTAAEFQNDIKKLTSMIPHDATAICGVARSGLSAATMVSMYLHLPLIAIRQNLNDIIEVGNGWRLGGSRHIVPGGGHVVVVDDTVMTGNSLRAIDSLVAGRFSRCTRAAVYVNPAATMKPDMWAVDLPWPHLLEWNLFNSVISPTVACDFDGVLCNDCPAGSDYDGQKYIEFIRNAVPRYTPRRSPIPLVVTARIEKYRPETEAWLRKWKIRVNKLVMHPASTLAERNRDNIPAYKARHFLAWAKKTRRSPGPIMFVESARWQAVQIARISKKIVLCTDTGEVFS